MKNKKQKEFIEAYNKCHDEFIRYCSVLTYGRMDTEDLVQEVLLSAYQNFNNIEVDKFLHYLIRAAKNISIDKRRKLQHRLNFVQRHNQRLKDKGILPEILTDITFLYEALAKLPESQREALVLFEVSGFSMKEIAKIQNSEEGAIRTKICRGREKLRKLLLEEPASEKEVGEKRSLILLLMTMKETDDNLFENLKNAPAELSKEDVEKIIEGFANLPASPPEPKREGCLQYFFNKIGLNDILCCCVVVVITAGFTFMPIAENISKNNLYVCNNENASLGQVVVSIQYDKKESREDIKKIDALDVFMVVKNEEQDSFIKSKGQRITRFFPDKLVKQSIQQLESKRLPARIMIPNRSVGFLEALTGKDKVYKSPEEALKVPEEVYRLDLSNNNLRVVPDYIEKFINLEELYLNGNNIIRIPEFVSQLPMLRKLHLHNNELNAIAESIGQLSALQELYLHNNNLKTVPKSIGKLSRLTNLHLYGNELETLPESIGQLSNLEELNLWQNEFVELPDAIGQLFKLEKLHLGKNKLERLPETIGQLANLEVLNLSYNQLKTLPESIGQLSRLELLSCFNNQLESLPVSIGQLSSLTKFRATYNKLKTLPKTIGQLSNLTFLDLSYNRLRVVPAAIGELSNLEKLGLSRNRLRSIPDAIANLSNLEKLGLAYNKLRKISGVIGSLSGLTDIYISGNPLGSRELSAMKKKLPDCEIKFSDRHKRKNKQEDINLYQSWLFIFL